MLKVFDEFKRKIEKQKKQEEKKIQIYIKKEYKRLKKLAKEGSSKSQFDFAKFLDNLGKVKKAGIW
jgi:23S rRNA pseudoU1915 N3-methylase RlmH